MIILPGVRLPWTLLFLVAMAFTFYILWLWQRKTLKPLAAPVESSLSTEANSDQTPEPPDETMGIRRWRVERFLELGFPLRLATLMAKRSDINWHEAEHLIDTGATVEEAEKILL